MRSVTACKSQIKADTGHRIDCFPTTSNWECGYLLHLPTTLASCADSAMSGETINIECVEYLTKVQLRFISFNYSHYLLTAIGKYRQPPTIASPPFDLPLRLSRYRPRLSPRLATKPNPAYNCRPQLLTWFSSYCQISPTIMRARSFCGTGAMCVTGTIDTNGLRPSLMFHFPIKSLTFATQATNKKFLLGNSSSNKKYPGTKDYRVLSLERKLVLT